MQAIPQNAELFTQGLAIEGDYIWQSSGLYGQSFLQKRLKTQTKPLNEFYYPWHEFAEGIALVGDHLYGLTWKSGRVYRWHKHTLKTDRTFEIQGEGWGMSQWQHTLAVSNGTNTINFYNPADMTLTRSIEVTDHGRVINNLNDLTSDKKSLWANIWHSNTVIKINAKSGAIEGYLDLSEIADNHRSNNRSNNNEAVLNGLAWDNNTQTLWLTGKLWDTLYQLQLLVPAEHAIR